MKTTPHLLCLPAKLAGQLLIIVLLCFYSSGLYAQHKLVLYQMQSIPQSYELNPGRLPLATGYVQLPGISGLDASIGNNSYELSDFGLKVFNPEIDANLDTLLAGVNDYNRMAFDVGAQLFGLGFTAGKFFISLGVRERLEGRAAAPRSAFTLAEDIDQGNILPDSRYDIEGLGFNLLHYRSFGLGLGMKASPRLSVGARINYLMGLEHLWLERTMLQLTATGEEELFGMQGSMQLRSAGLQRFNSELDLADYLLSPGNSGLAIDLGFNYRHSPRWAFSGSILDLGGIRWKNEASQVLFQDTIRAPLETVGETIADMAEGELESGASYRSRLPLKLYLNGQYYLSPMSSLGLLYNARSVEGATDHAVSLSFSTYLRKWIGLSVQSSFYNRRAFNLGTGLSLNLGPLQVFALSDNLLGLFGTGRSIDAHAGLNFTFGWQPKEAFPEKQEIAEGPAAIPDAEDIPPAAISAAPPEEAESPSRPEKASRREEKRSPAPLEKDKAAAAMQAQPPATFTLRANVRDQQTNEPAPAVYVDVYRLEADGRKTAVRRTRYPTGDFAIALERGNAYLLDLEVYGYENQQLRINPTEEEKLEKLIRIQKESAPALPTETAVPAPVAAAPATVAAETKQAPPPPAPAPKPATREEAPRTFGTYQLTGRTSLRQKATHESAVLQRLGEGQRVEVLEKTNNWWWKVRCNGRLGYVKAQLLQSI